MNDSSGLSNMNMDEALSKSEQVRQKQALDDVRARLNPGRNDDQKLREAVQGFEAIFIKQMWERMRATIPQEGYLHSKEEQFYQSMFDYELSRSMAESGGIGLGDMLYAELKRHTDKAAESTLPSRLQQPAEIRPLNAEKVNAGLPLERNKNGLPLKPGLDARDLYEPVEENDSEGEGDAGQAAAVPGQPADAKERPSFLSEDISTGRVVPPASGPAAYKSVFNYVPGLAEPSVSSRIERQAGGAPEAALAARAVNRPRSASGYFNQSGAWQSASARPNTWGRAAENEPDILLEPNVAANPQPADPAVKSRVDSLADGIEKKHMPPQQHG